MDTTPETVALPLKTDEYGTIRVAQTRVALESVVGAFQRGSSPEAIVGDFPVLNVADVYVVIGYYLQNRDEVDAYVTHQRVENERLRQEWEAEHPPTVTKADLLARMEAKRRPGGS